MHEMWDTGKKTKSINNEYKRRDPSQKPRKYFQKVQNEISLTQRRRCL